MPWIESHQSLRIHPKVRRGALALQISRPALVGHLHYLWWWALDHAEDGDLSRFDAIDIASAAEWEGDPDAFVKALTECGPGGSAGFLEPGGLVGDPNDAHQGSGLILHHWWEYAGKLIDRRMRDRARSKARRANSNGVADSLGTVPGRSLDGPATVLRPSCAPVAGRSSAHNQQNQPKEEGLFSLDPEEKPKKKPNKKQDYPEAFATCWAAWRKAGGRLSATKEKTLASWIKALAYLDCTEDELTSRVTRFLVAVEAQYLPDLAVALAGPGKGCQFTEHGVDSRESRSGIAPVLDSDSPFQAAERRFDEEDRLAAEQQRKCAE